MKRGWCPTVHEPMPTGDGLLLRIKPPFGRLSVAQARLVADVAEHAGNSILELTARGNLQLRGSAAGTARAAAAALVDAGLADADPGAERRRNVVVSPLAGYDPGVAPGTLVLAAQVEALLVGTPDLPAKFCVAIDGGGVLPLGYEGDVTMFLDPSSCPPPARGGGTHSDPLPLREGEGGGACAVGFIRYGIAEHGAFGIALPFGETDAPTLCALADLAERFSDGTLCLGPRRTVLLGVVRKADAAAIAARATAASLIADPADARLRVHACIGSRGCTRGSVDARRDAAGFARVPFEGTLHVSGCAKRCAHPRPATLTLIGENGRYHAERAA